MIDARFRPLERWTEQRRLRHTAAQFKSTYMKTLDKLEYELRKLKAKNIVIEAGFAFQDIRNDGWPFSGKKPSHPGVILYFDSAAGAMRFPCGTYSKFEHNMHAIALTLEALRSIDRYGVTMGTEQYKGFVAIGDAAENARAAARAAANTLANLSRSGEASAQSILANASDCARVYRVAAANCHPDRNAGQREMWDRLQEAKTVLDLHFAQIGEGHNAI